MPKILVINSGSATLKFKVFSTSNLKEEMSGNLERIGLPDSFLSVKNNGDNAVRKFPQGIKDHEAAFAEIANHLGGIMADIKFVGHRIVHGGGVFNQPTKLNAGIIRQLEKFNKLAPLHNPVNLACARSAMRALPRAAHFAIFDTAYYSTLPEYACRYALPEKYFRLGIRRYGFHGISHKYAAQAGAKMAKISINKSKIITCHLGSGCSLTATRNGRAIETTMGFTPLEGLTMSTRAGDLDASIPLYMISELKMPPAEIYDLFNKQSGLLGVAGIPDLRDILLGAGKKVVGYKSAARFSAKQKADCKLALDMFVYDIVRYIGQLATVMGGADLVVFTGGVGERSPVIRQMVLDKIKSIGKFKSVVVPADEELMIAKEILSQK